MCLYATNYDLRCLLRVKVWPAYNLYGLKRRLFQNNSVDSCVQLCIFSGGGLLWTVYRSLPNTICLFKLLVSSPDALVRWSYTILMSNFTLNTDNGFKFCVPQHDLWFLLYGRHCTDRAATVF
jgi:hypothetical protein